MAVWLLYFLFIRLSLQMHSVIEIPESFDTGHTPEATSRRVLYEDYQVLPERNRDTRLTIRNDGTASLGTFSQAVTDPASSSTGDAKDLIECPICFEGRPELRKLPACIHEICDPCAQTMWDQSRESFFPCPFCRKECYKPNNPLLSRGPPTSTRAESNMPVQALASPRPAEQLTEGELNPMQSHSVSTSAQSTIPAQAPTVPRPAQQLPEGEPNSVQSHSLSTSAQSNMPVQVPTVPRPAQQPAERELNSIQSHSLSTTARSDILVRARRAPRPALRTTINSIQSYFCEGV
ncbi:hypothetical protein, variant, partial [Puccinia triticina 1-1 BBBD Race 1]